jgi:HTH-type transcriptional regulator/antitoxin MqsA
MKNICPICSSGKLERKKTAEVFHYKNKKFKYEQPGLFCNNCGDGILDSSDMEATEPLLADFRAQVDGYLSIADIKRIRRKLRLTQKQAAEIFGGGHNAFSRYESGQTRPPKSTDNLLKLLDKHPELLEEIPLSEAA